jgi:hypothetical protein
MKDVKTATDQEVLAWFLARLEVLGDNPNSAYMKRFKRIIKATPKNHITPVGG